MKKGFRIGPIFLFYLMVTYIFMSYIWWTILLLEKNNEAYIERIDGLKQKFNDNNIDLSQLIQTDEYKQISVRKEKQRLMVLGESSVFLILILMIAVYVYFSFKKEIEINRAQKNFLLSITHELRSPIASAKLALQTLERKHELPIEKSNRLIHNALSDVDRLHSLIENLLLSAKIESASFHAANDVVNLSDLLKSITVKLQDTIAKNRIFKIKLEENICVLGDRGALMSVITNLLENAIKYSPVDTTIHVKLSEENDQVVLLIADEGSGIPESERKKIFKKFYRIGNEETRNSKGTGLGLYIVENIVALHRGKINVRNNNPSGAIFEITLPKIQST